ncbi:hypothetical protein [Eubacterium aggregans]|uniref:hypothetical protein n=1 Tax=Eubacterium aggregans TaxID=81409 RepID=UPI003F3D2230
MRGYPTGETAAENLLVTAAGGNLNEGEDYECGTLALNESEGKIDSKMLAAQNSEVSPKNYVGGDTRSINVEMGPTEG